ncbi:hypothetical protein D6D06_07513 [Aureobasidium pullulans]|nr:hypothetical protein D6D06_07513 [Aureobasidium pullulans]
MLANLPRPMIQRQGPLCINVACLGKGPWHLNLLRKGQSSILDNVEASRGPTYVSVPAEVSVKSEMTVEVFIKGRATALRELIPNPIFLQYGLTSIAATSSAAQDAV